MPKNVQKHSQKYIQTHDQVQPQRNMALQI